MIHPPIGEKYFSKNGRENRAKAKVTAPDFNASQAIVYKLDSIYPGIKKQLQSCQGWLSL